MTPAPLDWLVPDWPVPSQVRALCTTRTGGLSVSPWDSLNLGDHVGDDALAVAANRDALQAAIGARPVFLNQVHACDVLELGAAAPHGLRADASTTAERGVACTVLVADCLPVLLCNAAGTRVAAAHAGWRGLAGGVVEAALAHLLAVAPGSRPSSAADATAWLGPCIGPFEFEVGTEVKRIFERGPLEPNRFFRPCGAQGKWLADLAGLARARLQRAGVRRIHGNDGSDRWCTVRNPSRFFSHRRDAKRLGTTGRFAASVWLA